MTENIGSPASVLDDRIKQLIALYGDPRVSAAELLCDRHDPMSLAYRVIGRDLGARDISYGTLRMESERFSAVLAAQGVRGGDRVATLMGKSREYLVTLMGIWRLGAVHVPLFTALAPPAISLRLVGSGARIVVCDAAQRNKLRPGDSMPNNAPWRVITTGDGDARALEFHTLIDRAPPGFEAATLGGDAPLIHIYTSGTTGTPKAVVVPVRALAAFRAYAEFALDLKPTDLYWCAADPGWAYGLYFGILGSLATGTPSLLQEGGFSPEVTLRVLADQGVTNFSAAPTVYRALRSSTAPAVPIHLRCASSAGEPLTPEINDWAASVLGVSVYDHYGQTEAGMLINNHHNAVLRRPLKPGSMGQAMPGWTAVILRDDSDTLAPRGDIGRVAMDLTQSPLAWFDGYLNEPDKSAERFAGNGRWYLTGDVGRMDEDGYFHFSSRDDDVIIMAGYRIGPFEVESVIATHPAVSESAVIAVPDDIRGEVIEAYVVLRKPDAASTELALEIQQWVKTHYAAHAYPRAVHFVETLPKTPSGKIQRFLLKQQRRAELESSRVAPSI
ncbi:AMP-binding protein [Sphingomonas mali]|uniref:AMP-binding protein n=1 Tax=Sphingomonas mali TaxID=40682 RepID=UPI000833F813|nr:AMP-binding protein [Sphingomonas mali]